jgi:hypothetical protein
MKTLKHFLNRLSILHPPSSILSLCLLLPGCITGPQHPAATQPSTAIDPKLATKEYWLAQPVTTEVTYKDFTTLWNACEAVARDYFFAIDRRDYRAGLLSTEPLISKQYLEFWRKDAVTAKDVREDTVGGVRRTIYFQFAQNPDGSYTVAPKVLVERESRVDPKYRSPDSDLPSTYWYALRRDSNLEIALTSAVRERLDRAAKG